MPKLFGHHVSDGILMGTEGMKYSLYSREVIADSMKCRKAQTNRTVCRHTAVVTEHAPAE